MDIGGILATGVITSLIAGFGVLAIKQIENKRLEDLLHNYLISLSRIANGLGELSEYLHVDRYPELAEKIKTYYSELNRLGSFKQKIENCRCEFEKTNIIKSYLITIDLLIKVAQQRSEDLIRVIDRTKEVGEGELINFGGFAIRRPSWIEDSNV